MKVLLAALLAAVLASPTPMFAAQGERLVVAQAKTELVDINSAKAEELMKLKGIKEARAKAIIKGRPYARKDDLVRKKIVPLAVYNEIKDQIVAKQQAMDEALLKAMRDSMRRTGELGAQQTAELKCGIASQREMLPDLAVAAMRPLEINAPRDPADTFVIEDVVRQANRVLEYLEPPRH